MFDFFFFRKRSAAPLRRFLTPLRSRSLAHLRSTIQAIDGEHRAYLACELLIHQNIAPDTPGPLPWALVRIDYVVRVDPDGPPQLCLALVRPPSKKPSLEATVRTLHVVLEPFDWADVLVVLAEPVRDLPALASWYEKWIDSDESRAPDRDGLRGVMHRFEPSDAECRSFRADFGSAEVDVVIELLEVLSESGQTRVQFKAALEPG